MKLEPAPYQLHDWKGTIAENDTAITDKQYQLLGIYRELLTEWNTKVNLVSRKDESNIWPNHILHSISPLFMLQLPEDIAIVDIGSGGGLPGIPLAVMMPKAKVVMVESIKKKCNVLNDILLRLGIQNAIVVNGRAEDIARSKEYKNRFDLVVARAVAPLRELIKWSLKLVADHRGRSIRSKQNTVNECDDLISLPALLALKGGDLAKEISAARNLIGNKKTRSFDVRFKGIERTSLVDKKMIVISLSPDLT